LVCRRELGRQRPGGWRHRRHHQQNARVILSAATPSLASLVLSGTGGQRTLVFSNWNTALNASNVTI
jgi:primosomal protein N'